MLVLEFAGLFFVLPSLVALAGPRLPGLLVLWVVCIPCLLFLRRDPDFDRQQLWSRMPVPAGRPRGGMPLSKGWTGIVIPFFVNAILLSAAVWWWAPQLLFDLPRRNTMLWALLVCLYPIFSVYPQGLVYRVFFERRYAPLFRTPAALVIAGGVAFAYMHIVFRNAWAMGLSLPAGLLFFARYRETRSLMVSSLEHALYGCFIFTIGLGAFFYQGPMPKF
jgi:hypothetical protein